jgi:hypothetical protein
MPICRVDAHDDRAGFCVLQGVVQCLLGNPVQPFFDRRGQFDRIAGDQMRFDPGAPLDRPQALLDGADQPLPLQGGRPQLINQQAHFFECILGRLAEAGNIIAGSLQLSRADQAPRGFGQQGEAVKRLRDRVVQVVGQPLPFLHHCQLLGLLVQARVFHGYAHLVGDRSQKGHLIRAEFAPGLSEHAEDAHHLPLGPHRHPDVGVVQPGNDCRWSVRAVRFFKETGREQGLAVDKDPAGQTFAGGHLVDLRYQRGR